LIEKEPSHIAKLHKMTVDVDIFVRYISDILADDLLSLYFCASCKKALSGYQLTQDVLPPLA